MGTYVYEHAQGRARMCVFPSHPPDTHTNKQTNNLKTRISKLTGGVHYACVLTLVGNKLASHTLHCAFRKHFSQRNGLPLTEQLRQRIVTLYPMQILLGVSQLPVTPIPSK